MPALERDLLFLQAGVQELSDYMSSNELYWPLSMGDGDLSRLTIGGLLLVRMRLKAWANSPARQAELAQLDTQLETMRSKRQTVWERKAGREVQARLALWQNYLSDYRKSPEIYSGNYRHEVRWRVMLHLLSGEVTSPLPDWDVLSGLDQILKTIFLPGEFIWEVELTPIFPKDPFWFLYGRLKP